MSWRSARARAWGGIPVVAANVATGWVKSRCTQIAQSAVAKTRQARAAGMEEVRVAGEERTGTERCGEGVEGKVSGFMRAR